MSKKSYNIKSVIFDMDGVITNTMPDHYRAWKDILKNEGVKVTHYDIYSREGQKGMESIKEIFALYKVPFSKKKADDLLLKKEEYFKQIAKRRFILGARSFLKSLKRKKIKLALVTGTSHHELIRILPEKIHQLFEVVVTGCDVTKGKPHPQPYLKSIKKLNVKPHEAVVIENAPFGIRSAKAAGIPVIALETSLPRKYLNDADAIYASIKELQNKVKINLN